MFYPILPFEPTPSPFCGGGYGLAPMPWGIAGVLPNYASMDCPDADIDDEFGPSGKGPSKKYIRRMQKRGLMGPVVPVPGLGPSGAMVLAPWQAPFWRPRGGYMDSPQKAWSRASQRAHWERLVLKFEKGEAWDR
ncbi:hypothetical protein LTR62_005257 [Meristemomyces frigidus]|uniref:Uncharacterized protein n=1 Tax=Meristemomyces frigidus TaxID=1508187 RepID=A0AAN7YFI4_9PEZI|nr:hypothetical protein LTR62_005257 [Meristemomyces frigidus]